MMQDTQVITHPSAVSVSVIANQTPIQTPASYLATHLHFHGDAIKSNNKENGKKGDDGPRNEGV